jgi:O-antigen ligase
MAITDITNHYLLVAVQSGLVGLLAFCGMLVVAVRDLLRMVKTARDPWVVAVAWALFSGLAGLMVVFMSVSLFGQPVSLFYGFLGITASLIQWQRTLAPVTVRAVRRAGRGRRSKEVVLGWQSAGESRRVRHV